MNKAQKGFWVVIICIMIFVLIIVINPLLGLLMFVITIVGGCGILIIWALWVLYQELGDD